MQGSPLLMRYCMCVMGFILFSWLLTSMLTASRSFTCQSLVIYDYHLVYNNAAIES